MTSVIVLIVLAALLFIAAFLSKRRFGVLGLALGAGALLSTLWVKDLTPLIENAGVVLVAPPLASVVTAVVILLPALLLLFSGPKYHDSVGRLIGSLLFAVLAIMLLLDALQAALVIEGVGEQVMRILVQLKPYVVTACLIAALVDVLMTRTKHPGKAKH